MHHCLCVPEVFQRICDELDWEEDPNHATLLYALAQTCRSFQEPALASLWRKIPTLTPIIQCAGRDLWKVFVDTDSSFSLQLKRDISPSDIAVMKKYARLVRYFGSYRQLNDIMPVLPDVWKALRHASRGVKLFSNVRSVCLSDEHIFESIALFYAQNLSSIHISIEIRPTSIQMLADFFVRCQNLSALEIGNIHEGSEQPALVDYLATRPKLSQLVMVNITLPVLRALVQYCSTSLQHLEFKHLVPSDDILDGLPPMTAIEDPFFPKLTTLSFRLRKLSNAITLINYFPAPHGLQHLSMTILNRKPCSERNWSRVFQSLTKHSNSLKRLCIEESPMYDADECPEFPLSKSLMSTVATNFKALTDIRLDHPGGYDVNDEDLKFLAESLPLLEVFCLAEGWTPMFVEYPNTIGCLVFFVKSCPFLSHLALGFDAQTSKVPQPSDPSIQLPTLTWLGVSASPVDDPELVATFLSNLFPNLQHIYGPPDAYDPVVTVEPWDKICTILFAEPSFVGSPVFES